MILLRIMDNSVSAPNITEENRKLLSALRNERVRCKEFEKVAKTARSLHERVQHLERLCERLVADQQALRAEVRRDLAPLNTVLAEVNDLGTAVDQLQAQILDH